ncbi:hypothetical protein E4N72_00040 [Treponema vincentii]|uniref:hypothetical protein n=1 Tax=Treponema vincentii TaxID=69710 RepID=UPI0020A5D62F|nr:hypothetical protein [Treponema vincentii]UTC45085.1 hypothetical protein E4N72_00040 [Treponema vincentii]
MLATAKGYYNGSHIVLNTPVQFQQGQEVVITYTVLPADSKQEIVASTVDSLMGIIPNREKELSDYREERLKKYACID